MQMPSSTAAQDAVSEGSRGLLRIRLREKKSEESTRLALELQCTSFACALGVVRHPRDGHIGIAVDRAHERISARESVLQSMRRTASP
eukprot:6193064-Pleurochrysis_carterae.AAC.2